MKRIKKKLQAQWEILSTAEIVETDYKDKKVDDAFFDQIYKGGFVKAYRDGRCDAKQTWTIQIHTKAQSDDGEIHDHILEWSFNDKMTIREVLEGAKHIKMNNEFKTRWHGVTKQWLECVDDDLQGMTCLEAWCIAECVAMVKPEYGLNRFNKLMMNLA